jgi:hypothetical protein
MCYGGTLLEAMNTMKKQSTFKKLRRNARAGKALMKRFQKFQQLRGAAFRICFARSRKTFLAHPIIEVWISGEYAGNLCACTLHSPTGNVTYRFVRTHLDDRLHRITAKMIATAGIDILRVNPTKHAGGRRYDPDYEYLTEPNPHDYTITSEEARNLTAKATKNQAVRALRVYLRAVEKPPQFGLLDVPASTPK